MDHGQVRRAPSRRGTAQGLSGPVSRLTPRVGHCPDGRREQTLVNHGQDVMCRGAHPPFPLSVDDLAVHQPWALCPRSEIITTEGAMPMSKYVTRTAIA